MGTLIHLGHLTQTTLTALTLAMGTLTTASSVKSWAKLSQSSGLPRSMQWSIWWRTVCTCNYLYTWDRKGHLKSYFS